MIIKNTIVGAVLISSSVSAFADGFYPYELPFVSTKTRAEVIAELQKSQADGTYASTENEFNYPAYTPVATRTREDVIAELRNAQADGSLRFRDHDYPSAFQQPIGQRTATLAGKDVTTAVKN